MEAVKSAFSLVCKSWLPCKVVQTEGLLSSGPASTRAAGDDCDASRPAGLRRECSEARRVFDLLDVNGDGLVCARDLSQYTKRLGFELSDEDVVGMVKCADSNTDECLDFDEFVVVYGSLKGAKDAAAAAAKLGRNAADEEDEGAALRGAFSVFDKNMDGVITPQELQQVLLNLGLAEGRSLMNCKRMIQRVDSDGDGQVDFSEFKLMMSSDVFESQASDFEAQSQVFEAQAPDFKPQVQVFEAQVQA